MQFNSEGRVVGVEVPSRSPQLPATLKLRVSAEFVEFLEHMATEMGVKPVEVVRRALGLLRIALDAKNDGNKLAVVTPDLEVDQEITGI